MQITFRNHPLILFPDFRRFFLGRFISAVGDKFFTIALSWWVVSQPGANSRVHLGLLLAIATLPIILFGPFLGALADRYNKKHCMIIADGGRALILIGLVFLAATGRLSMALLYPACFVLYFFVPLFESSANGALEELTDKEHLSAAAAVNSSVVQLSNALGAGLGGAVLAVLGTVGAFAANAFSFMVSMIFLTTISRDLAPAGSVLKHSYLKQLREGFAYVKDTRPIGAMLMVFGLINFFFIPLFLFIPMVVRDLLKETVTWVGVFEGSLALGAVLAAFGVSFLPRGREYPRIIIGVVVIALGMLSFSLIEQPIFMAVALFFCGVGMSLTNAAALSLFQNEVPADIRGRFFSMLTTVAYAVMPLAFALNGALAQYVSLKHALLINTAGVALLSIATVMLPRTEPSA